MHNKKLQYRKENKDSNPLSTTSSIHLYDFSTVLRCQNAIFKQAAIAEGLAVTNDKVAKGESGNLFLLS